MTDDANTNRDFFDSGKGGKKGSSAMESGPYDDGYS